MEPNSSGKKLVTLNSFLASMVEADTPLVFEGLAESSGAPELLPQIETNSSCGVSHAIVAVREAPLHWKDYQPLLKQFHISCRDFGSVFEDWADFSSYLISETEKPLAPTLWVLLDQAIESLGGMTLAPAQMWHLALQKQQFVLVLTRNVDLLRIPGILQSCGFERTLRLSAEVTH